MAELQYFDIVVVVPLEEELLEIIEQFPSIEDRSSPTTWCHVVESGRPNISMLIVQQQKMGKTAAINAANFVLQNYEVGLIVCLGIAGSLSGDARLASVCYSGSIIDVLDNAKFVDVEDGTADTELSPTNYETPHEFTQAFNYIRTQPTLAAFHREWQERRAEVAGEWVPEEVPAPGGGTELIGKPASKGGVIVCGSVSKSHVYNAKLRKIDRALLAVETESGGVFSQADFNGNVPAITVRGISDYADKDKGRLEDASKGGVRRLAAANAASFLKLQVVSNPYFHAALERRRAGRQQTMVLDNLPSVVQPLSELMLGLGLAVDAALRKLSPEYKLQPKGYHLPLPRIRRPDQTDGISTKVNNTPTDVVEALQLQDKILVSLPRTYPDHSLAWVLADDLLTKELDGCQPVPVVINGEDIRGKKHGFNDVVDVDLDAVEAMEGTRLVLIVDNIPFASKHRMEQIVSEIDRYSSAKFVFITRAGDAGLLKEADFLAQSGAEQYEICAVSFFEIAHFIQKNFGMTGAEAEVVALRLRDTFDRFDLDAHPTYFAGIPRETLTALLQANRRSELIQLAVDGFLTFIVAGDRADVALSRSTRARFLRKLVIEINVEKRSFQQADLIAFTREFADLHDFDIDPLAFINGFVDQGILHFEAGQVRLSLPFVESYLLASELHGSPDLALRYFDPSDDGFDTATFDLYAEIGAGKELVTRIEAGLKQSMLALRDKNPGKHILLTDSISPKNLRKPERADALRKRLQKAADAVRDGKDESHEKQKMLDLSDKVREASARHQKAITGEMHEESTVPAPFIPLNNAVRFWAISTVLLGSGAEHLDAQTKRSLSSAIVSSAALVIDEWSRHQQQIDFEAIKQELTTDEALAELPGEEGVDEKRRFIDGVVDILEYSAMAEPLRRVLGFLCEQARHRVLAPSVEASTVVGAIEKIIHGTWLADIDTTRGKDKLRQAIIDLPPANFFRVILASHYLARVYWNHWHKEDRLHLLNAAEEVIRPLDMKINKSELKRMIEAESEKTTQEKKQEADLAKH
ncbi:Nucleoside phosphorylase [Devosia crocina]|uniref:Nucleoside phosphorylase n=1 Tax=Devosia crocina TaxID=429728 RepID=A0A1I7NW37_9HYPH|nr:hypothetical protein [Devosia crocina]SFV38798.1 Nucleoside phosphorylase [Devosia crocina]